MMKGNFYIEAQTKLEEIQEEKERLLLKAADTVSMVLMKMNQRGITDMKSIEKDVNKLISGFTNEEKVKILEKVIVKLTMNL